MWYDNNIFLSKLAANNLAKLGNGNMTIMWHNNMCSDAVDFAAFDVKEMTMHAGTFVSMGQLLKFPPWQQKWLYRS